MEAARSIERQGKSGLLLQVSPRSSRALWSNKGRQPDADGPGHDDSLCSFPSSPSRPQSRQRPVVISKMENTTPRGRFRSGVKFQPSFPPPIAARRCEI